MPRSSNIIYGTKIEVFTSDSVNLIVNSGNPIWLHSILVSNTGGGAFSQTWTITTGGSNTISGGAALSAQNIAFYDYYMQVQKLELNTIPTNSKVTVIYRAD